MSAVTEQAVDMVSIEVDGIALQVPKNSMIIEATDKAGISVPRFCYHRKLSIAANCRMCLVDVEKAPKPMPACATPVMDGMKVYTRSRRAIDAQHGVMEFLLINHPLDCPICDQGGECELQDLAMGYGRSVSRFTERKRVVKDKDVGPLIKTDMTRCIHCTRCVRFLDEVAGTSEMGGSGRGDRLEIGTCIENSIDSELSGNIIDLCPVGALTNKPYRYSARAWELASKASHALHDGVCSSLYFHTRRGRVMRAVPRDNDALNETWLSDRDRYSHFGLYASDRLTSPRIKRDGQWQDANWDEAMAAAVKGLQGDGKELAVMMSPSALTEEYYLASKLAAGLGCGNIDHRLREVDFQDDQQREPRFAGSFEALEWSDCILLLGSNIRHEAPMLGHRVRKAWQRGAKVMAINPLDWNFHFDLAAGQIAAPQQLLGELMGLAQALASASGQPLPESLRPIEPLAHNSAGYAAMAEYLQQAERAVVLVGQAAMMSEQAAWLRTVARWISHCSGADLNLLPIGANTAGAALAGALPAANGLNAASAFAAGLKRFLLFDFEPDRDTANPWQSGQALSGADFVVAVTPFAGEALMQHAQVLLPLAPWPESEGSVVSLDGQSLHLRAAGSAQGQSRPGWKILRRMGNALQLDGFDQVSLQDLQQQMAGDLANETGQADAATAVNETEHSPEPPPDAGPQELYRIGDVPMYSVDALCRRSPALQSTTHAPTQAASVNPQLASERGWREGQQVIVTQGQASVSTTLALDERVPTGAVWLPSGTDIARQLGHAMGPVSLSPEEPQASADEAAGEGAG